jgi:hypothetical protein
MTWTCLGKVGKYMGNVSWAEKEIEPIQILMTNLWQVQTNYMADTNTEREFKINSGINTNPSRMTEVSPPINIIQS